TLTVSAEVVRPGRSVELVEASLADAEGEVMRARAWRLVARPVELDPAPPDEPPAHGPADGTPKDFFPTGSDLELGPAVVWMRMRHPLVEGEEPTPLQRVLVAADSGNGVSASLDYRR